MKVKRFARKGGKAAILGQVVHNEQVVQEMEDLGVATIEKIDDASESTIVFSAHGVPPSFHDQAKDRKLEVLDTTCKFVYDIHRESQAALDGEWHLVFIGDPEHREVIGYTNDLDPSSYHILSTVEEAREVDWSLYPRVKVFYQTTLNAEDYEDVVQYIEKTSSGAERADTICYATKENQDAARELASNPEVDLILIIGGRKSANTRHLWEICRELKPAHLVHEVEELEAEWFEGVETVGVTAGASTPDYLIDAVEARVEELTQLAGANA